MSVKLKMFLILYYGINRCFEVLTDKYNWNLIEKVNNLNLNQNQYKRSHQKPHPVPTKFYYIQY